MKKFIPVLVLLVLFTGCTYRNFKAVKVKGQDIKTPYGKAKGDMYYQSTLCFPDCGRDNVIPEEMKCEEVADLDFDAVDVAGVCGCSAACIGSNMEAVTEEFLTLEELKINCADFCLAGANATEGYADAS